MTLERHYRRLLLAYPREYRERRGEEIVATLLDGARSGQRRPDRYEAMDLLTGGLRERLGVHDQGGLAGGLALTAPLCLALAAAYPISYWIMGARSVPASAVAMAWLLAVVLRAATPRPSALPVGLAVVSTMAALVVGYYGAWSAGLFIAPAAWGTLAFAGILAAGGRRTLGSGSGGAGTEVVRARVARWSVPLGVATTAAMTALLYGVPLTASASESTLMPPIWAGVVLPLLGLVALIGGVGIALWRGETRYAWASCAVLIALAPTLLHLSVWWWSVDIPSVTMFGRTNLVVFVMVGAVALLLVRAGRGRTGGGSALHTAGGVALGLGAASAAIVLAKVLADGGEHLWVAVAALGLVVLTGVLDRWLPALVQRIAALLTLAALASATIGQPSVLEPRFTMAIGTLVLVGLLTRQPGIRSWSALVGVVGSAATILLLVWIYFGESLPREQTQTGLIPMLTAFALSAVALCAIVTVLRSERGRWQAASAFAASMAWMVAALWPATEIWAVGVTVVVATGLLLATSRFIAARPRRHATPLADQGVSRVIGEQTTRLTP